MGFLPTLSWRYKQLFERSLLIIIYYKLCEEMSVSRETEVIVTQLYIAGLNLNLIETVNAEVTYVAGSSAVTPKRSEEIQCESPIAAAIPAMLPRHATRSLSAQTAL